MGRCPHPNSWELGPRSLPRGLCRCDSFRDLEMGRWSPITLVGKCNEGVIRGREEVVETENGDVRRGAAEVGGMDAP